MEIRKKDFNYRGMGIDQLKALDVREFAKFVPSRSRRTLLRNFQKHEDFLARAKKKQEKNRPIKTHSRELVIVPQMIGMKIGLYNGKEFVFTVITAPMIGHRLGEFALTRGKIKHGSAGVGATKGSKALSKK
jgi:small subunit ribosomal protein S19